MLQLHRRAPLPPTATVVAAARRWHRRPDEVIRVGRMPRTDTFQIGIEILPRPREDMPGRARKAASR